MKANLVEKVETSKTKFQEFADEINKRALQIEAKLREEFKQRQHQDIDEKEG